MTYSRIAYNFKFISRRRNYLCNLSVTGKTAFVRRLGDVENAITKNCLYTGLASSDGKHRTGLFPYAFPYIQLHRYTLIVICRE